MYTASINGLDLGGSPSIKGLKKHVEDFALTYSGSVFGVIKNGKRTGANAENGCKR